MILKKEHRHIILIPLLHKLENDLNFFIAGIISVLAIKCFRFLLFLNIARRIASASFRKYLRKFALGVLRSETVAFKNDISTLTRIHALK